MSWVVQAVIWLTGKAVTSCLGLIAEQTLRALGAQRSKLTTEFSRAKIDSFRDDFPLVLERSDYI